jgi:hypothetical protein
MTICYQLKYYESSYIDIYDVIILLYKNLHREFKQKELLTKAITNTTSKKIYYYNIPITFKQFNDNDLYYSLVNNVKKEYELYILYHKKIWDRLIIKKFLTRFAMVILYRYPNGLRLQEVKKHFLDISYSR